MPIQLNVSWPNSKHALVSDALARIELEIPGEGMIEPAQSAPGERRFTIPDSARSVVLRASFMASFEAFEGAQGIAAEVLAVHQAYSIDARGKLSVDPAPEFDGPHPLVTTELPSNSTGVIQARIQTQFVDITPFWMEYAGFAAEYLEEHHPDMDLVAVGSTAGEPKIWFASIPRAAVDPPSPALSALVFFRPSGSKYDRIDQKHDMFGLNRYLLKPVDEPIAEHWRRDRFTRADGSNYVWLRCGFEEALARSGKPVVMLHPWPSELQFGRAITADLPREVEGIVRMLWANQSIARGRGGVKVGRLGLAGYSAGGLPLFDAFMANRGRVDELWSFDARGIATQTPGILAWLRSKPDARLFMTGAFQLDANMRLIKQIQTLPGAAAILERVVAEPRSSAAYEPGQTPLWDSALVDLPDLRSSDDVRHQFAIFGGFGTDADPPVTTSLERFLAKSLL